MFIGHGLLAFALVALVGHSAGWVPRRTLTLAVFAAAFATLPDVDILYAPVGLLGASGTFVAPEAFWETGNVVHRALTHSLPVAVVAAVAFGLWSDSRRETPAVPSLVGGSLAVGLLAGLVVASLLVSGGLGATIMAAFALGGLALAAVAVRRDVRPTAVVATALVGLGSHPFGDLFTGEPPAMFYPLDVTLVAERVTLNPDPTLHLLSAFGLELLTVWAAAVAYMAVTDRRLGEYVSPRAAIGAGYAVAVIALPAPTLATSYQFVFSVLSLGVVGTVRTTPIEGRGGLRRSLFGRRPARADAPTAVLTGLTAITLGGLGYALAYVVLL